GNQVGGCYGIPLRKDDILGCALSRQRDLRMAEIVGSFGYLLPLDTAKTNICQAGAHDLLRDFGCGQWVLDNGVKSSEHRSIQHLWVIRGSDEKAVGLVLF